MAFKRFKNDGKNKFETAIQELDDKEGVPIFIVGLVAIHASIGIIAYLMMRKKER